MKGTAYALSHPEDKCLCKMGETKSSGKVRARYYAGGVFDFFADVYRGDDYKDVEKKAHHRARKLRSKEWLRKGHREVYNFPPAIGVEIIKQESGMKPHRKINFHDIAGEMATLDSRYKKPLIDTTSINWDKLIVRLVFVAALVGNTFYWSAETWDLHGFGEYFWRVAAVFVYQGLFSFAVGYFGYLTVYPAFLLIEKAVSIIIRKPFMFGETI